MIDIFRAYQIHQQILDLKRSQGVCRVIGWLLLQVRSNEHRDRFLNQPRQRPSTPVEKNDRFGWSQQQAAVYQSKR